METNDGPEKVKGPQSKLCGPLSMTGDLSDNNRKTITNMNWSYELSDQHEHSLSINGTRSRNSRSDSTAHQNFNKNNQSFSRSIHLSIRFNNNIFGNFSRKPHDIFHWSMRTSTISIITRTLRTP